MNYKHIIKAVFVSGLWLSQVSVALANDKDSSTQSPIDRPLPAMTAYGNV